jgi:two-component system LytT family response regulator/two-component system response regulator LytT
MLSVFIVEDEFHAREKLKLQLSQLPNITLLGEAEQLTDAVERINLLAPNVVFLDIELGEHNGFSLFDNLNIKTQVIFTTAYSDFALKAFDNGAIDYLLKPFNLARLTQALSRIVPKDVQSAPEKVKINAKSGNKTYILEQEDIAFFQTNLNMTIAQTRERNYVIDKTLEQLDLALGSHFVRVHRNAIINTQSVDNFVRLENGNYQIQFIDCDTSVTTSRSGTSKVKQYFNLT